MNLLQNFHLAVIEYFCCGRRAVPLQTFTTRQSNRKLSIVMALSTTFTQYASEITKFCKIRQNKGHFAVQGHSSSPILEPIESPYTTSYQRLILTYLLSCTVQKLQHSKCQNRYISLPLLRLNPPTEGFPWDDLYKFSMNVNGWPRQQTAKKNCRKIQPAEQGAPTLQTDRRQTERRQHIANVNVS